MGDIPLRKIIHIDCDCFYAAVEVRDNPKLANLPIVVGGNPNGRSVVATASYEARKFGVRSAMSSAQALKLCPDLIFLKTRMDAYREASQQIHRIFADYTDLIEPLSLDEAYLDVTDCELHRGSATLIAEEIRRRVVQEVRITVSAGVAPNKFLAKVASDWNKPDGLCVITPAEVDDFVAKLPVAKVHGVGKVTQAKMQQLGIETCGQLRAFSLIDLVEKFGSFGQRLHQLAWGIDERPVRNERRRKSLSVEHTYEQDLHSFDQIRAAVPDLLSSLNQRLEKRLDDDYLVNKYIVKVKFNDFVQTTFETRLDQLARSAGSETDYLELLNVAYHRRDKPVRLLGIGVGLKDMKDSEELTQMDLFSSDL
ncbi:DNA polymerase IV [Litoribrevibacter albus]|uniref:DNA polymerase IV n=1 Tax=Litoribrevibacter albus TaxID=1473156 RepID=A0AA37S9T4_9GAMM|nr:DNA polymerase IV [Litoribrevibacter albus]GLQ31014.1 DNA polymerase IV [Litoribrevibacter albus]